MKKTIKYLFPAVVIALAGAAVSCEDDLDVDPNDAQTELDFLNNPNNAVNLVNGVYSKLLDYNMYSFSWIGITSITSDDADKGSTPTDYGSDKHKMDNLTFEPHDVSFLDVWQGRYGGINRANSALFYLEQLQIDPTLKSRLIGEVKFLRALFYFDLVRCFGGVPVVTQPVDLNDTETINDIVFTRKTKQETYAQIEADLLDAIDRLPPRSGFGPADTGRATKGAAQGLLAKAYLYQERWQEAYDMTGEVIGSGLYGLLDDYGQVWREAGENGLESVFEVQATLTQGLIQYTDVQGPRGTPDLGWGFNTPSIGLVNAYEDGDLRKEATIMFVPGVLWDGFVAPTTWTNPRYNYKAYHSSIAESWDGNKGETAKNYRVLKFSDIMLIRAEAGYHVGGGDVVSLINQIRERAGLDAVGSVTLEDIWKERRLEMAMEHDRWFDLVRTGQAVSALAAHGKTFQVGRHELFPIPEQERVRSGNRLEQNPGY